MAPTDPHGDEQRLPADAEGGTTEIVNTASEPHDAPSNDGEPETSTASPPPETPVSNGQAGSPGASNPEELASPTSPGISEGPDVPPSETPETDESAITAPTPQPLPVPAPPPDSPPGGPLGPPSPVGTHRPGHMAPPRPRRARSRSLRAQRTPIGDGRLVKERIRHISPRSVLKISVIFYTCVAVVFLVAGFLLWSFARGTGTVDDTESFVTQLFTYGDCVPEDDLELGQEFRESDECPEGRVMVGGFQIDGGAMLRAGLAGSVLFVILATLGTVFMVLLFNILSDITGGVRYTVVREPLGGR